MKSASVSCTPELTTTSQPEVMVLRHLESSALPGVSPLARLLKLTYLDALLHGIATTAARGEHLSRKEEHLP